VLERAGLVSKRRNGREQLVTGEVATLRAVHQLLDRIEVLWQARVGRMGEVLATPDGSGDGPGPQPGLTRPTPPAVPPAPTPDPRIAVPPTPGAPP
jgi:hypothetical protein